MQAIVITPLQQMITRQLLDHEAGALMSLVWNIGAGALKNSKQLLPAINSGNLPETEADWVEWDHAGGKVLDPLLERRRAELAVYCGNAAAVV